MTVFRGKNWVKGVAEKSQNVFKKIQLKDLTARIHIKQTFNAAFSWLNAYKLQCLKGVGALGLLTAVSIGGHQYVKANTFEIYHVYVGKQVSGVVSDPRVVEKFILDKYNELALEYPGVTMELNADEIRYESEKAFKAESDDQGTLVKLEGLLKSQAYGAELKVDGKVVAIVKDKETANDILGKIKNKYTPKEKGEGKVSILSNDRGDGTQGSKSLESVEFMQNIELEVSAIQPNDIMEPDEVLHKLETGDVQPIIYVVEKGDCVSCIADKFNIDEDAIRENNPWIIDDMIRIGDELDLTVLQPTLSVKSMEKVIEDQEIQYETIYRKDPTLRAGNNKMISSGKNGMKKVTYLLIKVNGKVKDEQLVGETMILEPVAAIVKKGTKVIRGEGSGRFSWPVVGARLTSSFGQRWGRQHKGIDLASKNRSILAADNAKVLFAGVKNGYGNVVILDHLNGYRTLYAHLSKITVSRGSTVEKGDKIGVMGNTGESHGVHLHFEVHKSGNEENPMKYLRR